ncbi:MAG TPA: MotA/TolQ/ExbB proton channel family protein [Pseudomonadales bacterium]|nr:MotA/TolQ/ExbB proton channel family protein [Pseudomonadales bacterium]
MEFNLDMFSFWQQGDVVSHAVLILLVVMSVTSWAIIFSKSVQLAWWQHANGGALDRFWQAQNLEAGVVELARMVPFRLLVEHGNDAVQHYNSHRPGMQAHLDAQLPVTELVTRALRQALNRATADLERGQVFLASIGSVSPFVGLLGTVWGIYHALAVIGATGQASLDKVAGPVGEALIMTAIGLFVAIPAVLAYNAFNRVQRLVMADLDGFAHDLLMYFTMGSHVVQKKQEHK